MSTLATLFVAVFSMFSFPMEAVTRPPVDQNPAVSETFEGTVLRVEKNDLVLSVNDGEMRFRVADDAMIFIRGANANLEDLGFGYMANVSAAKSGNDWIADFIDAKPAY